jgi:hypothetical protein
MKPTIWLVGFLTIFCPKMGHSKKVQAQKGVAPLRDLLLPRNKKIPLPQWWDIGATWA